MAGCKHRLCGESMMYYATLQVHGIVVLSDVDGLVEGPGLH